MAGRIGGYIVRGPASPGRTVRAGLLDGVVSLVATMLAWPFPIARATLSPAVHVAALIGTLLTVDLLYRAVLVRFSGRTVMMYFNDLGLSGPTRPFTLGASLAWALGWTVAYVPGLLGMSGLLHPDTGLPARLSGLITVSAE